jgi:hypothetical protein
VAGARSHFGWLSTSQNQKSPQCSNSNSQREYIMGQARSVGSKTLRFIPRI